VSIRQQALAKHRGRDLETGEELLAAVRTQTVPLVDRGGRVPELNRHTLAYADLGLTDRRLIVWRRSYFLGRTLGVLAAVPIRDITHVGSRVRGQVRSISQLELSLRGEDYVLDCYGREDLAQFVAAWGTIRD